MFALHRHLQEQVLRCFGCRVRDLLYRMDLHTASSRATGTSYRNASSDFSFGIYEDGAESVPRITCPQKMLLKLEKSEQRKRDKSEAKRKKKRPRGPLLISCKRKSYNFHKGQDFDESNFQSLVSCGWKNTKRVGDHFTLLAHSENPSFKSDEEYQSTFEELGLSEDVCSGLAQLGLETPTHIQTLAIPSMLRGENVIIAAETGSGKTLSYLLPCIEWIKKKKQIAETRETTYLNCPNVIVITPNRELSSQVSNVAESLASHVDFLPQCSYSGHNMKTQEPMDMLVTTPGSLKKLLKRNLILAQNLQHLVIDESDTLLDDSFVQDLQHIFSRLNIIPAEEMSEGSSHILGTQLALVSATMPRNITEAIGNLVPVEAFTKITTRALHRLPPHVPQKFVRINPDSKAEYLIQLLSKCMEKKQSCLVFVKDNKTCFYVASMLKEMHIPCLSLNGDLSQETRRDVFQKFTEGYEDILVATDIASRGLDTTHVSHVINFDFPQHMSDYIHRVGRVGRVGSKHAGQVTSLVSHKWDVDLLWKIEVAARKDKNLSDVNANIKQKIEALKFHKDTFELNILS